MKKGQVVRLRTGGAPIRILAVCEAGDMLQRQWRDWYQKEWRRDIPPIDPDTLVVKYAYLSSERYLGRKTPSGVTIMSYDSYKWRPASHFEDHPDYPNPTPIETEESEKPMTQKLYKTNDGKYGTFLTRDSEGNFVLELKGGEGVAAYLQADLEEVRPYTVEVKAFSGSDNDVRNYGFKKGSVKVGDVLMQLSTGNLFEVTKLDSKADARKSRNGFIRLANATQRVEMEK